MRQIRASHLTLVSLGLMFSGVIAGCGSSNPGKLFGGNPAQTADAGGSQTVSVPQTDAGSSSASGSSSATGSASGSTTGTSSVSPSVTATSTLDVPPDADTPEACEISFPKLTGSKPALNGVLVANDGDRLNATGPYRTRFSVSTSLPDGALVLLNVQGAASVVASNVVGGSAEFSSVELGPDGVYDVQATCGAGADTIKSDKLSVPVDTQGPTLGTLVPAAGAHYSPSQDVDSTADGMQFDVLVPVTSNDALGLSGKRASNVCVAVGTQAPNCAAATAGNSALNGQDGAAVRMDCPGSAGFDLRVTVYDAAGNSTEQVIAGVTCASTEPSVQIVSLQDATNQTGNVSLHLLAASAGGSQLKDEDSVASGGQHTLVACTNALQGSGRLLAAGMGATLKKVGVDVNVQAAQPGDNCPSGLSGVLRFTKATLPESVVSMGVVTLTELKVEVTDVSSETNQSSAVRLWVDSIAPSITLLAPSGLCDSITRSAVDVTKAVTFFSSDYPTLVTATVEASGGTGTPYGFTASTPQSLAFPVGINTLKATTTDSAGNNAVFKNNTCKVTVGEPPTVTWVRPATAVHGLNAGGSPSNASTLQDGDLNAGGWQGSLQLTVADLKAGDVTNGSVVFKANNTPIGTVTLASSPCNGGNDTCTVTLSTASIPDAASVVLTAVVQGVSSPVEVALPSLAVDTILPGPVAAVVPYFDPLQPTDRRRGRFTIGWNAAGDGVSGTEKVGGYEIAYSPDPIITAVDFDAAQIVRNVTAVQDPGGAETAQIDQLAMEQVYYFAVRAVDGASNAGPILAGVAQGADQPGLAARFITKVLSNPVNPNGQGYGFALDGSSDLDGDGLSELVVSSFRANSIAADADTGTAAWVFIYKGTSNGYSDTPMVTITGKRTETFGFSAAVVGDINGDTLQDLVVVANQDAGGIGRAYVFQGRANWAATPQLTDTDADAVIEVSPVGSGIGSAMFLVDHVARLGDYNGDGTDDFALGHYYYSANGNLGVLDGAVSIILGRSNFADLTLIDETSYGTANGALMIRGSGGGSNVSLTAGNRLAGFSDGSLVTSYIQTGATDGGSYIFPEQQLPNTAVTELASGTSVAGRASSEMGRDGFAIIRGNGFAVASPAYVGAPLSGTMQGAVDVYLGDNAVQAFGGRHLQLYASSITSSFGNIAIGNGFSGRAPSYSKPFLGLTSDGGPNLIVGGAGGLPKLFLLGSNKLSTTLSTSGFVNLDAPGVADAVIDMRNRANPPDWTGVDGAVGAPIYDLNGDGYSDFAIGASKVNSTGYDGHVIVFY